MHTKDQILKKNSWWSKDAIKKRIAEREDLDTWECYEDNGIFEIHFTVTETKIGCSGGVGIIPPLTYKYKEKIWDIRGYFSKETGQKIDQKDVNRTKDHYKKNKFDIKTALDQLNLLLDEDSSQFNPDKSKNKINEIKSNYSKIMNSTNKKFFESLKTKQNRIEEKMANQWKKLEEKQKKLEQQSKQLDTNEAARKNAETEREKHEAARKNAETARETQEAARKDAEIAREKHEAARKDAETAREKEEAARKNAETDREKCEADRKDAETDRDKCEADRKDAEIAREKHEAARKNAEIARETQEAARKDAETAREKEEAARKNAEIARKNAEIAREEEFNALKAANEKMLDSIKESFTTISTLKRLFLEQREAIQKTEGHEQTLEVEISDIDRKIKKQDGIRIAEQYKIKIQKVINQNLQLYENEGDLKYLNDALEVALRFATHEGKKYNFTNDKFFLKQLKLKEIKHNAKQEISKVKKEYQELINKEYQELINKEYHAMSEAAQNILGNGKDLYAQAWEMEIQYDMGTEESHKKEQEIKKLFLAAKECFKTAKQSFIQCKNVGKEYKEASKYLKNVELKIAGNHKYDEAVRIEKIGDELREKARSTQNQEQEKESNAKYKLCLDYYHEALSLYQKAINNDGISIFQKRIANIKNAIEEVESDLLSDERIVETTESTYHIPVAAGSSNNENHFAEKTDIGILGNVDDSVDHTYEVI